MVYVNDKYQARFCTQSYHRCKETHTSILLDLNFNKVNRVCNVGQGYLVMVHACRV